MTNTKSTKRALLASIMAMLLCFTMLLGTTFAWFTDSASTAVNKIQAGTLDVQLLDENGNSLEGQTLVWQKATGHESEEVLWEPGCTYKLQPITIKNAGNLALKYKVIISGINGSEKLNEVIDWKISGADTGTEYHLAAGASNTLTIEGHMQESAGNEYQGLSIDGIGITVVATQDTVEYDSNNNTYDTNATYLNTDAQGNYLISNANELVFFAKAINTKIAPYSDAGKNFKLTADIDLGGRRWAPIGRMIDTYGTGESSTFCGNFDGGNFTISNFKVDTVDGVAGVDDNKGAGLFGAVSGTISNLKVTNATIVTAHWAGAIAGEIQGTVKNCSVDNITITCLPEWTGTQWDNGDKAGSIVGYLGSGNVTECTAKNVSITGYRDLGGIVGCSDGTVTNNTVGENVTITYDNDATRNYNNYTSAAQHNIGDYIGRGADENDDGNNGTVQVIDLAIATAEELFAFAKDVNENGNSYSGKTVALVADIDLNNQAWTPIGQTQVSSFQGTFDGQGHTIKNMTVNYTGTNSNYACGLFGWIELHNGAPIVIQNVKFDNANVTGIKYTGVVAGYANGASGAEIKNCVVTNSTVTSNSKNAGGIIGYMGKGVLTGNTVSGCTISAKCDVGGIANSVEPAVTFTKNKVENTKIYYEEDQSYDAAGIFTGGKVVYRDDNNKTTFVPDSTNTNSNVTVNKLVAVSTAE